MNRINVCSGRCLELISDTTGTLSHTKVSVLMANVAGTVAFLYQVFSVGLTVELLLGFLAAIGAQRYGSKYLDIKGGG